MKQLFGTEALQVLPAQNGFIFVMKQEEREEKAVVTYKLLDFDKLSLTPVTRNVYLLAKFGNQFERYDDNPDDFLHLRTLLLGDRKLLSVDLKGKATVTTPDGKVLWRGELVYNGCPADGLALGDNRIYVSYPEAGAVLGYNAETMRQEIRLGGGGDPLPRPEGLYYQNEQLLICMPTEKMIGQLDLKTFQLSEYESFDQGVHRYVKVNANEVVMLDSGVYKL